MKATAFQKRYNRKPAKSEHCLQRQFVNWLTGLGSGLSRGRFFAVPNGGGRTPIQAAMLKAEGVRAGVPDMVLYAGGAVMFLELKNGTSGRLSPAQVAYHKLLRDNAMEVRVCRTLAECMNAAIEFFSRTLTTL